MKEHHASHCWVGLNRGEGHKVVLRSIQVRELPCGPGDPQRGRIPLALVSPSTGPLFISDTWIFPVVKVLRI